jgi:hypothetical protein
MASLFKSRAKLESEILVLRQRINALRRRTPTVRSSWGRAAELVLPPLRFHQIADCKYDVGDYGNPNSCAVMYGIGVKTLTTARTAIRSESTNTHMAGA